MKFDRSRFIARFAEESREHVDFLSKAILDLEARPDALDGLDEIKRAAHTLKGSARMLKFLEISRVAHGAEDVFIALMERKIACTPALTDLLLACVDYMSSALDAVVAGGAEPPVPEGLPEACAEALQGEIRSWAPAAGRDAAPVRTEARPTENETAPGEASPGAEAPRAPLRSEGSPPGGDGRSGESPLGTDGRSEAPPSGDGGRSDGSPPGTDGRSEAPPSGDDGRIGDAKPTGEAGTRPIGTEETLRVSVDELDTLVDSVGEASVDQQVLYGHLLGLLRRGKLLLEEERERSRDGTCGRRFAVMDELVRTLSRLEERSYQLNSDLQVLFDETQRLRMIPLSTLFDRFVRPVRDLARAEGKQIRLEITGGEMRLDKQIVDRLHGPLLHILNNAVAHAVESPEERARAKKDPVSVLHVDATSQAGAVEIAVRDDGRGMDGSALRRKAIERGLIDEKEGATLSRQECLHLAFRPGVSSAPIITELSGRGVGMDVVKKTVEELKGSIDLQSEEGEGTCITLRLPLSLSSRSVFLVDVGSERCAIPLSSVFSTYLCEEEDFIEVAGRRALRVENLFVPVADARDLLGIRSPRKRAGDRRVVLVLSSGSERLALVVDELVDEREILIKPLHPLLEGLRFVGGITFGDQGEPLPVLYVPDLIESARRSTGRAAPPGGETVDETAAPTALRILVVDDSFNTREVQRHILESAGYEVGIAGDGLEALERLEDGAWDAVVTDVDMPRMDGFELVERLRGDSRWTRLPVIIVTSRETEGDRARGIEVGANAYIVKRAFDQEKLTSTLAALVP